MKRRPSRASWMTQRQDATNKRLRRETKPQRGKRLWQKRRSPINGIGLFAALPIRPGTPIIEFKGRVIPWEEGAVMLLRGEPCYQVGYKARHGRPTAVESGRSRQPRLFSQLRHQKEARWPLVNQYALNRTARGAFNRLRLRIGRRI